MAEPGVFNVARVQSMFVISDESNLSRFGFVRITKRNCLDFQTKPKQSNFAWKQNEISKYFRFKHPRAAVPKLWVTTHRRVVGAILVGRKSHSKFKLLHAFLK